METKKDKGAGTAELLSVNEAGDRLSLSPWTIRAHVRRGFIKSTRCGKRVLIPASELRRIQHEGLPSLRDESRARAVSEEVVTPSGETSAAD